MSAVKGGCAWLLPVLLVTGCAASDPGAARRSAPPADAPIRFERGGPAVIEVRGLTYEDARRRLRRADLTADPLGDRNERCVVAEQSPAPGGRTRSRVVRLHVECAEANGACGPLPGRFELEAVSRAHATPCAEATRVLSQYLDRASEGKGIESELAIDRWRCILPLTRRGLRSRAVYASCTRGDPPARILALIR